MLPREFDTVFLWEFVMLFFWPLKKFKYYSRYLFLDYYLRPLYLNRVLISFLWVIDELYSGGVAIFLSVFFFIPIQVRGFKEDRSIDKRKC